MIDPDGDRQAAKAANSMSHENEGQNVLFLDGHVDFEEDPFCGVDNDNIYTQWDVATPGDPANRTERANGIPPGPTAGTDRYPMAHTDAVVYP